MGSGVGKVEDEGFLLTFVFIKAVDGVASEGVGMVELLIGTSVAHNYLVLNGPASCTGLSFSPRKALAWTSFNAGIKKVTAPVGQPVVTVKPTGGGQGSLVPLARNEGSVTDGAQDLPEGGSVFHIVVSNGVGVVTGKKLSPGGVTLGGVIELGETQSILSQFIYIRRFYFPSIASDIGVAHIVDHNENEIGPTVVWFRPGKMCAQQK